MIDIRFLKISERPLLDNFLKSSYSENHILRRREFLDWYTIGSPFYARSEFAARKEFPIIAAISEGRVIGQWICQPNLWNARGRLFSMLWTSNWMVDRSWRHRGLGGFLVKFLLEQKTDVLSANMVTPEARRLMEGYGYIYRDLHRYLAVLSPEALRLSADPEDRAVLEKINTALIRNFSGGPVNVQLVDSFGDEYQAFWEKEFAPKVFGSVRSAAFLNWRYGQDPFFRYQKVLIKDNGDSVAGMVVFRIEEIAATGLRACRLVEFFTKPELVSGTIRFLLERALEQKCVFLDFYNLFSGFDREFAAAGILKNDPALSVALPRLTQPVAHENWFINAVFLKKNLAISSSDFSDFDRWYTTSGDADQDRKNFY